MTTMGRKDGFLSGAYGPRGGFNPSVDATVLKAIEVASIPVYCAKNEKHVMKLVDVSREEICPLCKAEGVRSDVYVKQAVPAPVFRDAEDAEDDEAEEGDDSKQAMKSEMYETGGMLDGKPIVTKRGGNPRRGTWTGTR
jgi:hypothetical protein